MEITGDSEARNQALDFLRRWENREPYITARTSGSTGTPKEIHLPKSDMVISARATCSFFNIDENSTLYLPLSVNYIAGMMMIVRAYVSGATLIVVNPSNALRVAPDADIRDISLAAVVPSQVPGILSSPSRSRIRNLIVGGAPLPDILEQRLVDAGVNACVTYGMTETASHVALRRVGESHYRALTDITFSTDCRGCLVIHSNDRSFRKLVTNDLVELSSPTDFRWLGRIDNVINSGGVKVSPETVERRISALISGRDFCITSRPSEKWGREVILAIEGTEQIPDLPAKLREILPPAERPKEIIYRATLPRTATGKLLRTVL